MRPTWTAHLAVAALAAFGAALWLHRAGTPAPGAWKEPDPLLTSPRDPQGEAAVRNAVAVGSKSRDPNVQDRVGKARLRLAYADARKGDFTAARSTFLAAAKEYKGTGAMSADWGGIPDQAAYQAAVCLVAEGKKEAAQAEFARFMKERPLSPLVHSAHRRLARLNGATTPEQDALLQTAVTKQEARIRFETSVCGPKAIEHLLPRLGKPRAGYKEIARLCGTTDGGTTVEGMRRGLRALGIGSFAYKLNRRDLEKAPVPAILLEGDHYVALVRSEGGKALVYDPRFKSERELRLPPLDDPDFSVSAILFSEPELQP